MSAQPSLGVFLKGELADSHGIWLDFIISAPGQRLCLLGLDPRFVFRRGHLAPERGEKFCNYYLESDILATVWNLFVRRRLHDAMRCYLMIARPAIA